MNNQEGMSLSGVASRKQTEVAVLAAGCFWGVEQILRDVPGVIDTEVGYTGGWLDNPKYADTHQSQSGHAEAIRVTFDLAVLSYEDLLEKWFFKLHDPTTLNRQGYDAGTQYRSAIFPQTPQQKVTAERVRARVDASGKWNDVTPPGSGVFQFTPDGSACSIQFGKNLTFAAPGSAQRTYLIVFDIEAARNGLVSAGIEVSEIFHLGPNGPVGGPDPEHGTYASLATFNDPDGNSWLLQEITTRLPGRIDSGVTSFGSTTDLITALRRAEAAHGEHEKLTGVRDANWADWYAAYMAAEQTGAELPH